MRPQSTSMSSGSLKDVHAGGFQFGIRKQENGSRGVNSPLKVSKDSHRIRKPPLPLPQVQYRPPIIIHTYSPKVIHTEPDDFMSLVQKLTGSSDTRLRLKKPQSSKTEKPAKSARVSDYSQSSAVANLERQGSGSSAMTNCVSPSTSEDSSFRVSGDGEAVMMKQSNSPRSPLDSHFEFDNVNETMLSHFDAGSAGSLFSLQQVKAEPMFAFNDSNPFSFFTESTQPCTTSRAPVLLPPHSQMSSPFGTVMDPIQSSSGFLSPNFMNHGLPDPSPAWSQSFLDCLGASAPGYQAPFPRQRFTGSYSPSTPESSTMVALENIHAFMLA